MNTVLFRRRNVKLPPPLARGVPQRSSGRPDSAREQANTTVNSVWQGHLERTELSAIILVVAALSMRTPPGPTVTNLSLNVPSKNSASPLKYASRACLSRARSASEVGGAVVGLAPLVFAFSGERFQPFAGTDGGSERRKAVVRIRVAEGLPGSEEEVLRRRRMRRRA